MNFQILNRLKILLVREINEGFSINNIDNQRSSIKHVYPHRLHHVAPPKIHFDIIYLIIPQVYCYFSVKHKRTNLEDAFSHTMTVQSNHGCFSNHSSKHPELVVWIRLKIPKNIKCQQQKSYNKPNFNFISSV